MYLIVSSKGVVQRSWFNFASSEMALVHSGECQVFRNSNDSQGFPRFQQLKVTAIGEDSDRKFESEWLDIPKTNS